MCEPDPMKRFHRVTPLRSKKRAVGFYRSGQTPTPDRSGNAKPKRNIVMKTLQLFVIASLALVSSLAAHADISAPAWLETYYLDPQPSELPRVINALSRSGYFEQAGHTAVAIGFLSTVFAQNPERVDRWLMELNGLPIAHQRLIAAALWQAGHPLGSEMLNTLAQSSSLRVEVQRRASRPSVAILDTPVLSPSSMNLQWGAFLATGDERHIVAILDGIGADRPALSAAARYALAQNAAAHPRVLDICRAQLAKQPGEAGEVLRAVLNDANAKPRS